MMGMDMRKANRAASGRLKPKALRAVKDAPERLNHLGVEVFDGEAVTAATERLKAAGLETLVEDETTCCYAKQDKVWTVEPQGLRWEWYRVLEHSETFSGAPSASEAGREGVAQTVEGCCG